jgi:TonB-linked SusC/RagA family outer membrane protein
LTPAEKPSGLSEALQQQQTITGRVTDSSTGEPMPGVNIQVKGTILGAISDSDGRYKLDISDMNATLVFSFIGYVKQEISLNGRKTVDVSLESELTGLDEVVVIGYGTQKVKELTGAVSQIKSESLEKVASSTFTKALQGQIAGVNVMAPSGAPGSQANIQIRGIGSFSAEAIRPLYVVDGIPYDNAPNFSSDEIESIEVLKDAASASIYGTRASNGVILVTTKKGKVGQMRVGINGYYGITDIRRNIPLIHSTIDWLYVNRLRYLAEAPGYFGWTALVDNPNGLYYNTNWLDLFQVDNAPIQNYSVQLSGGREGLEYSLVTSYFNQQGLWVNSKYERITSRGNAKFIKGKFSANVGLSLSYDMRTHNNATLPSDAIRLRPFKAPIDADEFRIKAPGSNAAAVANIARRLKEDRTTKGNSSSVNMELNYEVFKGLTLKANLGGSLNESFYKLYEPAFELYNEKTGAKVSGGLDAARLTNDQNFRLNWITEFMAVYEKSFNKHNFSAVVATSMEQSTRESYSAHIRTFLSNDIEILSGGSTDQTVGGDKYVTSLLGNLGRLQYNYDGKYLFSASVRRDGSSKFGKDNKYGVFPSFSVGWVVSDESFYNNSKLSSILPFIKLRASYGTAGNQFISDYLFAALISSGYDYSFGRADQTAALGAIQTGFSNANVKWETSISRNFGIDLRFLNGALTFTADYYVDRKKDMLFPVSLPPSAGTGSSGTVIMNIGNMANKGIELSSTYKWRKNDFDFSLTGIFMKNVNEVTQTNLESSVIWGGNSTTVIKEGYSVGTFFLIPHDGLVDTAEELAAYKLLVSGGQMGDIKYTDVNNDGLINDDDRVAMGSGTPKWEAGLTLTLGYKNFDLYVQTYGTYGNKIYNDIKRTAYSHKRHLDVLNSWSPANPTSTVPTPKGNLSHDNYRTWTDYYLEDGSYFRVRNLQLGYNFPTKLLNRISVDKIRFYMSVENPVTFTRYSGNDPEVGGDGLLSKGVDSGNIPVTSQYLLGFQFDF